MRRPVGRSGARGAAVGLDQLDAAIGVQVGAHAQRVGDIGDQRRLLGVERTAHAAVAEARAALDVAPDQLRFPAQLERAVPQLAVVAVDVVLIAGTDRQALLDGREVGRQLGRVDDGAVVARPQRQRAIGGTKRRRPVDGGSPAHGAALQDQDRQVVGRAVAVLLVQVGVGPRLLHVEVAPRMVRALFDDGDARAAFGQHGGGDAAAGAAADHDEVVLGGVVVAKVAARADQAVRAQPTHQAGPCGTTGGPG
jgi:hypothetical protein